MRNAGVLLAAACLVGGIARAAEPPGEIDRIVASIGTEAIALSEVRDRARSARSALAEAMDPEGASRVDVMRMALDDLVAERLVLAEARKLNQIGRAHV